MFLPPSQVILLEKTICAILRCVSPHRSLCSGFTLSCTGPNVPYRTGGSGPNPGQGGPVYDTTVRTVWVRTLAQCSLVWVSELRTFWPCEFFQSVLLLCSSLLRFVLAFFFLRKLQKTPGWTVGWPLRWHPICHLSPHYCLVLLITGIVYRYSTGMLCVQVRRWTLLSVCVLIDWVVLDYTSQLPFSGRYVRNDSYLLHLTCFTHLTQV